MILSLCITSTFSGITRGVDEKLLEEISSPPQREGENWFVTPEFHELGDILTGLIRRTCGAVIERDHVPCETVNLDIAFVLDGSGSVCNNRGVDTCHNWELLVDFVYDIVESDSVKIGYSESQVAVIVFSSTVEIKWYLEE